MNLSAMLAQWKMAKRYGYRRDLVEETLSGFWERFWRCQVLHRHQKMFGSHGACYRCGKGLR